MSSSFHKNGGNAEAGLFVAFMQIADAFGAQAEQVIKTAGLTAAQYNVLRILRGAGPAGLACREIGERMISRDPDITRLLDRMEKRNLITRKRQSDDRRVVKTFVTSQGLELLKILDRPVSALHKRQFQDMAPAKLKVLAAMLEEIRSQQAGQEADCDSRSGALNISKQNDSK
ncbi:MAG TPA: MarR family transcriptional regulator [Methylomirabilota bacterium]|nr:MarR family transcriptional regulator [Methylomirabilota bacterium]